MAIFNPDAGGIPSPNLPDQTGASRGIDTNRAFQYLFEGLGDAVGGVAKAVDNSIKTTIDNEAQGIYDNLNKPYTETIPAELTNSGAAMQSLQTAYEQGKISDTYYYGQLTALTKKMRAKYPGYESYVDETIQGITGVRPANAYRNALLQEFSDLQSAASDSEKFKKQWEKENEEWIAKLTPNYFKNPNKYNFDQVRVLVSQAKANDQLVKSESSRIELLFKQNQLTDQQAEESGVNKLNTVVSNFMTGINNAVGFNGDDFMQKIADAADGGYSPEEITQLTNEINLAEGRLRVQLNQAWSSPLSEGSPNSYSSIVPGKGKELIEQALAPLLAIKEMITNGDVGLAGYYTRINSYEQQSELNRILNASPDLKTAMALKDISPDLATQFINESGKQVSIFKEIAPEVSARVMNGQDDVNAAFDRVMQTPGASKDKIGFINATLDNLQAAITTGMATPDQVKNVVKSLYAVDENGKDIFSYVQPDQYMRLYNRMFNDTMTQAIVANGSREDLIEYQDAARARIFAIPELRQAAAALNDTQSNWKNFFEVQANPTTGRLELNVKREAVPMFGGSLTGKAAQEGLIGAVLYQFDRVKAEGAINSLNNAFDTYGKITEQLGVDQSMKPALYSTILRELNVDLEQGEKDSFFGWLMKSVDEFAKQNETNNDEQLDDLSFKVNQQYQGEGGVTGDVVMDTIIGFEGFLDKGKWDVNALRAGYGSDTITAEDGSFRRLTKDDVVDRAGAERDLRRRLDTEFIPKIVGAIGEDTWSTLTAEQQSALASITYNYGTLPMSVVRAVKTGDAYDVVDAIRKLETHNGGINKKRRNKEADLYEAGIRATFGTDYHGMS